MVRPVTAQRTKSPGLSTCTSPSRYLSLASPLKPILRSKRFIKAARLAFSRFCSSPLPQAKRKGQPALEECPLLSISWLARLLRRGLRLSRTQIGMSPDMAIGELNVESSPSFHRRDAAQHRAVGAAHQREAARKHILIAERGEKLRLSVELPARALGHTRARAPPGGGRG